MDTTEDVIKKPLARSLDKLDGAASNSPSTSAPTPERIGPDSENVTAIHAVGA
jgi:hypothetical protein